MTQDAKTRITITPGIRFGKPCIKSTRIAVSDILNLLAAGYSIDEVPGQYPSITREDVIAALEFASDSMEHPVAIVSRP